MPFARSLLAGAVAGACGTVALDIATYADMALRARPASAAPAEFVKRLAAARGIASLSADDEAAENRRSGVAALLGYVNGLGIGVAYGAIRPALPKRVPLLAAALVTGGAAMAASDIPMTRTGATDPKRWGTAGWLADAAPHLLYGLALALAYHTFRQE